MACTLCVFWKHRTKKTEPKQCCFTGLRWHLTLLPAIQVLWQEWTLHKFWDDLLRRHCFIAVAVCVVCVLCQKLTNYWHYTTWQCKITQPIHSTLCFDSIHLTVNQLLSLFCYNSWKCGAAFAQSKRQWANARLVNLKFDYWFYLLSTWFLVLSPWPNVKLTLPELS